MSQGVAETSTNTSAYPVYPRPFFRWIIFHERLSKKGTSVFLVFLYVYFDSIFPSNGWSQIQSWPQSCQIPLWSTLTLVADTQTCWQKHHFRRKMTQANNCVWWECWSGRVDFFGGFLVLRPSAVWVKCKQTQTQGDMIQKSIGIYASFKMSDFSGL